MLNNCSVKVMRSYDYCHFEIALGVDGEPITLEDVDSLRKQAQRLADKAVEQYKIAQRDARRLADDIYKRDRLREIVEEVKANFPESDWTPEQKAQVRALEDYERKARSFYDYHDDWDLDYENDDDFPF